MRLHGMIQTALKAIASEVIEGADVRKNSAKFKAGRFIRVEKIVLNTMLQHIVTIIITA